MNTGFAAAHIIRRALSIAIAICLVAVALAACGDDDDRDAPVEASVRGSWLITPQTPGPPFQALAAFGAGGVFITTGSDIPGTGIGQWVADGVDGFIFTYHNYHFDGDGSLAFVTTVHAMGTVNGDTLTGVAQESTAGPDGEVIQEPREAPFTGERVQATFP